MSISSESARIVAPSEKAVPPPRWQTAEVVEIVEEAPEAVTLRLALEEPTGFLPGQYYNVRLAIKGRPRPVQRAYSVASSPLPDAAVIDLGVREVPDGLVSPRLVRGLSVGERVEVRGPTGRFTWTEQDGGPILLVGAGSGLVPLVSMIRYGAAAGLDVPMSLVCSSASFEYALYHDGLDRLAADHSWLRIAHSFTRDASDPRATYHRRIDGAMLSEVLDGLIPKCAYLCGPPAMVEDAAKALAELRVDASRVRTEKYD